MKTFKFILLSSLIIFGGVGMSSADIGDRKLSVGAGLAFPSDDLDDVSDTGLDLQARYLQGFHPNVDFGGQLDFLLFGEEEYTVGPSFNRRTIKSDVMGLTMQGLVNVHPANSTGKVHPYGFFGLGLGFTSIEVNSNDESETGFTFSLGGGVDFDLNSGGKAGVSLRLQDIDVDSVSDAKFFALMGHLTFGH